MSENAPDRKLQQEMHKDFFDRCRVAMDNDCFFEAMLMEYAAIEARLEVIMGVLGLPCNKNLSQEDRRSIYISNRIRCLKGIYRASDALSDSPVTGSFWKRLEKWIGLRNTYIHGLYKNEIQYRARLKDVESIAAEGYELASALYKEAKRLRRLLRSDALSGDDTIHCARGQCAYMKDKKPDAV